MKKIAFLFSVFAFCANAQASENILFKISDITQVKDEDQNIVACDYVITAYNRTDDDISNIVLELSWDDETVKETIKQEQEMSKNSVNVFARGKSQTQKYTASTVNTKVSLPPIPSKRQIVSKQKLDSKRCFILLNPPAYNVPSCNTAAGKKEIVLEDAPKVEVQTKLTTATRAATVSCNNLFTYIDVNNPEYHTQFSNKTAEETDNEQEMKLRKDLTELNTLYHDTKKALDEVKATIEAM